VKDLLINSGRSIDQSAQYCKKLATLQHLCNCK